MKRIILLALFLTSAVHAQVHRCVDQKTGKFTYSDTLCDTRQKSTFLEGRKSDAELWEIQKQADQANERKYRAKLDEFQNQELMQPKMPQQQVSIDKSNSYECRLAQKNHETTASSLNKDKHKIKASELQMKSVCGLKFDSEKEPVPTKIAAPMNSPGIITHCDTGFCYDNTGVTYHRNGPDFLVGPNGKVCNRSGSMWICN